MPSRPSHKQRYNHHDAEGNRLREELIIVESDGRSDVINGASATSQQRTERTITLAQPPSDAQKQCTNPKTKGSAHGVAYPILVDGILNEESNTQHKDQDTYLAEEVFADKLLVVKTFVVFVVCTHCGAISAVSIGCSMRMLRLQIRVTCRNGLLHGLFLHLFHRILRLRGFVSRKGSHWHMQLRLLLGQVVKPLFGVVALRFVVVALLFGIVILHNGICLRCLNLANSRCFCLVQAVACTLQLVFCLLWLVLGRVR